MYKDKPSLCALCKQGQAKFVCAVQGQAKFVCAVQGQAKFVCYIKKMRPPGIEPGSITWQATIITTRPRTRSDMNGTLYILITLLHKKKYDCI